MQFSSQNSTRYSSFPKRLMVWTVIFVLFVLGIFIYSETAHAGLVSYMHTVIGGSKVSAKINAEKPKTTVQSLALLQPATNLDPNPEKASGASPIVGDTLVADVLLSETASSDAGSTQISSYVVREGDTISGIAKMFGVSVNTIVWANDLNRANSLRAGQTLIILPVTGINYTIKKGDTIKGIAQKYKADVEEILQYNDLDLSSTLIAGQTILIPDAEVQVSVPTRVASRNNPAHDTNGPDLSGYFSRPVTNFVCTQGLHGYNGVDLAASYATPIYAAAAGQVIVSASGGWNGGYGNMIIISHDNGTQTLYGHLSKNLVAVGQTVSQGQKIALMGATGKVAGLTGVHLHFEIRGAKNPFTSGCGR